MARPKKQKVDYFPHYCNGSKSLFILQRQYGNDGYAFWFKLLQLLGKSEGHYFDYSDDNDMLFLLTETDVPESKANQILETLADIGSIDKELWEKKKIWSQNFVDNVADVYARRKMGLPGRPGATPLEEHPLGTVKDGLTYVKAGEDINVNLPVMIKHYEGELGKMLTPPDFEKIKDFIDNYPDGWFKKAVDEVKNSPKAIHSPMSYIAKVMESWKVEGVNPLVRQRAKAHQGQSTKASELKESTEAKLR